jgi:alkylation response protein AidB-like acyl-CoA dehydrogenase
MVDLLIPICKAGNTDLVWHITAEAIQVYGGYGSAGIILWSIWRVNARCFP